MSVIKNIELWEGYNIMYAEWHTLCPLEYPHIKLWEEKIKNKNPNVKIIGVVVSKNKLNVKYKSKLLIEYDEFLYFNETINHLCDRKFSGRIKFSDGRVGLYYAKKYIDYSKYKGFRFYDNEFHFTCERNHNFSFTMKRLFGTKGKCATCPICINVKYSQDYIEEQIYFARNPNDTGIRLTETPNISKLGKNTKLSLICKNNHRWNTTSIDNFINKKYGCPKCSYINTKSNAVRVIEKYLDNKNINYVSEYRFDNCINKQKLPFDFYIKDLNLCIEYDGIQHFKVVGHWGGEEALKQRIHNDSIKTKYCKDNNIILIRIRYDEDPIEILSNNGII